MSDKASPRGRCHKGLLMTKLSPNAQLVAAIFAEVAKGNGGPFWEACHDDVIWRTIGEGSWSGIRGVLSARLT